MLSSHHHQILFRTLKYTLFIFQILCELQMRFGHITNFKANILDLTPSTPFFPIFMRKTSGIIPVYNTCKHEGWPVTRGGEGKDYWGSVCLFSCGAKNYVSVSMSVRSVCVLCLSDKKRAHCYYFFNTYFYFFIALYFLIALLFHLFLKTFFFVFFTALKNVFSLPSFYCHPFHFFQKMYGIFQIMIYFLYLL